MVVTSMTWKTYRGNKRNTKANKIIFIAFGLNLNNKELSLQVDEGVKEGTVIKRITMITRCTVVHLLLPLCLTFSRLKSAL